MDQRSKTTSHSERNSDSVTRRTWFRSWFQACQRVLHPILNLTSSRQQSHHPTSTSSSFSSPTTTASSDRENRDGEDQSVIDSPPVPVSNSNVEEMTERGNPLFAVKPIASAPKPTQNPKTFKEETTIKRRNLLFADSGRAPLCADIPEWLQEFRENLVDERVPEHRDSPASSSHETSLKPTFRRREDLGKHSVYTHFPKDRNWEICQRTKITRAPCKRRK